MDEPDEALMLRYRDGDAGAFEILYRRHKGSLFRYFRRQCGSPAVAEELFQDVWMKLINARGRYQPRARFTTYLFHLAHNRMIDHYRRQARGIPVSFDDQDCSELDAFAADQRHAPDRQAASRERAARLLELLGALPEAQREAFLMREEAGLSLEEIAEATGVGRETAKSRLRYAVAGLRRGLGEGE